MNYDLLRADTVSGKTSVIQQCSRVQSKGSASVCGKQGFSEEAAINTEYQNYFVLELSVLIR